MTNIESLAQVEASSLNALKQGIERTAVGAHGAIKTAVAATHPAVDQLAASSHGAVDRASGIATHAADVMSAKGDALKDAQTKMTAVAASYVHEHPLMILGLAAVVGFAASRYLSKS